MKVEIETIKFFKEIAKIPRESGKEEKIAKYLCKFAKERNLFYKCDEYNNVIIKKKTSEKEPIILQAHTDMVCEKENEKDFNFDTDSIKIIEENGYIRADGTTLGADNGIGVAQILAILDSNIPCNIEALFTTCEETSMKGAINFDTSELKGKRLLNLDGFEENTIIIESACFYDIILKRENNFKKHTRKNKYEIQLKGMLGGHSGFDIDKNRGNSNIEICRILNQIPDIEISDFEGGNKFNVIPSQVNAKFYTDFDINKVKEICKQMQIELKEKYPEIEINLQIEKKEEKVLDTKETKKFLDSISKFPHGVIKQNLKNEVTTSINLGVINLKSGQFKIGMRSSRELEEQECLNIIKQYSIENKMKFTILGSQPGFKSDENCELIQDLLKTHPFKAFEKKPSLKAVHITVEVGFFKQKIPDIQIAIISPKIQGAHTPKECVEIESIKKTDKWIVEFLAN